MKKLFLLFLILVLGGIFYYFYFVKEEKEVKKEVKIIDDYNQYIKKKKKKKIYDSNYEEIGTINKNIDLELDGKKKNNKKLYYKIKDTDNYILNGDISKIDPFIINDNNKIYVEYLNRLVYVNKNDVKIIDHTNRNEKIRNNIRTFTYHAIFKDGEPCKNKVICHPYKQFDTHMGYLAKNNYLTLTMEELEMFLDKKINIPMKSVVITLDDGNLAQNAIEILDKYKLYATYFIITGKYDTYKLKTDYVDFESHTDDMHHNWKCPGGNQGGQILCESEENILKDLKTSQEKLGGAKYLSYPFFDFNDRAIRLLKKAGFIWLL